ncbi:MAG: energy transducer TonB [Candidatus Zixiibacteriota bacterium]|nr:MAG: energy transducer TonB [candidate division Zixibacteria bacterium]
MKRTVYTLIAGLCLALVLCTTAFSGDKPAPDTMPEPVGGMAELGKNVIYPASALKDSLEGTVYVQVQITMKGQAQDAKVIKGVRQDLDQAAVEAVAKTKWTPARQGDRPVEVTVTVPVQFKMSEK